MGDAAQDLRDRVLTKELDDFIDWYYKPKGEKEDIFDYDFDAQCYKPQKRKERKMSTQQITVGLTTKESKFFDNETIWGVKVGSNSWMDLHTPDRPAKGQTFAVETWTIENKGRTYVHARPVVGQQPIQPAAPSTPVQQQARPAPSGSNAINSNRTTPYTHSFSDYEAVARKAATLAGEIITAPGDTAGAQERLVATFLIAFGDGKLALEPANDWEDVATPSAAPAKYEKTAAHEHLLKTIWTYFERISGTAEDALAMFKEISGKNDILELNEKEAIATRLKAEKIIDEKTDYMTLFTAEAKKIAAKEGWDFAAKDPATISNKKALALRAGITKPFKDLTQADLKAAVEKLVDDVPF